MSVARAIDLRPEDAHTTADIQDRHALHAFRPQRVDQASRVYGNPTPAIGLQLAARHAIIEERVVIGATAGHKLTIASPTRACASGGD